MRQIAAENLFSKTSVQNLSDLNSFVRNNFVHPLTGSNSFSDLDDFYFAAKNDLQFKKEKDKIVTTAGAKVSKIQNEINRKIILKYFPKPNKTPTEQKACNTLARLLAAYQLYQWNDIEVPNQKKTLEPSELITALSTPLSSSDQSLPVADVTTKAALEKLFEMLLNIDNRDPADQLDKRASVYMELEATNAGLVQQASTSTTAPTLSDVQGEVETIYGNFRQALENKNVDLPNSDYESADSILHMLHEYDTVHMNSTLDDAISSIDSGSDSDAEAEYTKAEGKKAAEAK
ncbi:MAG TPA: hypothetical protein VJ953_22425 [Saprospiraceae bacterium]|nr:hypothetical protein [Saprospiraceae bacterium]